MIKIRKHGNTIDSVRIKGFCEEKKTYSLLDEACGITYNTEVTYEEHT